MEIFCTDATAAWCGVRLPSLKYSPTGCHYQLLSTFFTILRSTYVTRIVFSERRKLFRSLIISTDNFYRNLRKSVHFLSTFKQI